MRGNSPYKLPQGFRSRAENINEVVYCRKRAEIPPFQATLLHVCKQASKFAPPSRDIISAKIHKSHPHLAVAVTHPPPSPVAKSQSRSIYYPPPPSNVFLAPAPSGTPDSSVKIACLARLPPPSPRHSARVWHCRSEVLISYLWHILWDEVILGLSKFR